MLGTSIGDCMVRVALKARTFQRKASEKGVSHWREGKEALRGAAFREFRCRSMGRRAWPARSGSGLRIGGHSNDGVEWISYEHIPCPALTGILSGKVDVVREVAANYAARREYDFSIPPSRVSQTTSFSLIVSCEVGGDSHPGGRWSRDSCGRSLL